MTATDFVTDWRALGACLSADPDLFFPISATGPALAQIAQAKAICADCQVRQACLDFALQTHQIHGVWGGTSAEERQSMRRRAPVRAGSPANSRSAGNRPPTTVSSSRPPAAASPSRPPR